MLEEAGIIFEVIVSSTDEELLKNKISSLPFSEQVIHLARAKAKFISEENPPLIWTSYVDTMVSYIL